MRLHQQVYICQGDPKDTIREIVHQKKTGALTLHFSQGGICKQTEWREKVVDQPRETCEPVST